jgi:hypothetical protein
LPPVEIPKNPKIGPPYFVFAEKVDSEVNDPAETVLSGSSTPQKQFKNCIRNLYDPAEISNCHYGHNFFKKRISSKTIS